MDSNSTKNIFIIILVLCLIGGIYMIFKKAQPTYVAYEDVQKKIAQYEALKKQIENLQAKKEAYEKAEKNATKPVYKSDIATADQMSSFGVMFEDVIQSAKYNGLKLRSISYDPNPPGDVIASFLATEYNSCAIQMQLIGSYMQFRSYFQDIYNYPYLINLDKVSVTPYAANKKILIADVTVIIYSAKNELQKAAAQAAQAAQQAADDSEAPATPEG